jgi:quinol monooxygenase YgiN
MSTSEPVIISASIPVKPGEEDRAIEAFSKAIETTHAQDDGCLLYALHRDNDDPSKLLFIEKWASRAQLDAHLASPHVAELGKTLGEVLAGAPTMVMATAIPAGDAEKGVL